jgi:CDGSH-type Zn-finger protein
MHLGIALLLFFIGNKPMPHRSEPIVAKKSPYVVELEAGKNDYWCSCGRSKSQSFCDGSHQGSNFEPVKLTVEDTKKAGLCGCKHTKNSPYCDRAHSDL